MTRTSSSRRAAWQRGLRAEAFVATELERRGWRICARNWIAGGGELDLVVERPSALRFVEVRARQPGDDTALESIDHRKQRKLVRAARAWMQQHPPPEEVAFLVAIVCLDPAGWTVEWMDDAFDG